MLLVVEDESDEDEEVDDESPLFSEEPLLLVSEEPFPLEDSGEDFFA